MRVIDAPRAMQEACRELRRSDPSATLGLVPTMGALHEGHLSLVRAARERCNCVAASIFVNPLQFGPAEDFSRYPRTFEQDCELLEAEGVSLLFAPTPEAMYPAQTQTVVDVPEIGSRLDGASRPGHLRGVATVVSKLFHIVSPDAAFFGQKDAAQVAVLRAMVRDLNFDLDVVVCPTVREASGLAMSSRNRYLSGEQRREAEALSRSLFCVQRAAADGERDTNVLRHRLMQELTRSGHLRVDYASIVDPDTLGEVEQVTATALVAVAAWVGGTRLIDNVLISAEPQNR